MVHGGGDGVCVRLTKGAEDFVEEGSLGEGNCVAIPVAGDSNTNTESGIPQV